MSGTKCEKSVGEKEGTHSQKGRGGETAIAMDGWSKAKGSDRNKRQKDEPVQPKPMSVKKRKEDTDRWQKKSG